MRLSRRRYLGAVVAGSAALAGCSGGGDDSDDGGDTPADVPEELRIDGTALSTRFPATLLDPATEEIVVRVHYHPQYGHWHRSPIELPLGEWRRFEALFRDIDREAIPLGEDEQFQLDIVRSEATPRNLVEVQISGSEVEIRGTEPGGGDLFPRLVADGDVQWTSPALPVTVR